MDRQNILFAIIAIAMAGFLTYVIFFWSSVSRTGENRSRPVDDFSSDLQVLVAAVDIPLGKKLEYIDMRWQKWPKAGLSPNHAVRGARDIDDFVDNIVKDPIPKGHPIFDSMITRPKHRGVLANIVTPGMRAVSIAVDRATGVSGFVFPGDFVDVILTIRADQAGENRIVSETIMKNIKVLALDQSTSRDINQAAKLAKTITLEVSPRQAENLAVAQNLGSISLSLHSVPIPETASNKSQSNPPYTKNEQKRIFKSKITIMKDGKFKSLELED